MTTNKIYVGSVGPFLYDDTDLIDDNDGDFAGEYRSGFTTNGTLSASGTPENDNDLVRKIDMDSIESEAYFFARVF